MASKKKKAAPAPQGADVLDQFAHIHEGEDRAAAENRARLDELAASAGPDDEPGA